MSIPEWDLPDRLRKTLRHAGVSSQEMSQLLEVSRHTISNWLNGHTRPRAADLRVWADRCDVPYEWLAHGVVPDEAVVSGHKRSHLCAEPGQPGTAELATTPLRKPIQTDDDLIRALRTRVPISPGLTVRTRSVTP